MWKLPTSTQLRATWHTVSIDMVVLPSTGASLYHKCCIYGGIFWMFPNTLHVWLRMTAFVWTTCTTSLPHYSNMHHAHTMHVSFKFTPDYTTAVHRTEHNLALWRHNKNEVYSQWGSTPNCHVLLRSHLSASELVYFNLKLKLVWNRLYLITQQRAVPNYPALLLHALVFQCSNETMTEACTIRSNFCCKHIMSYRTWFLK
jgi:hypothetical protein